MSNEELRGKEELSGPAEQTYEGPTFSPLVDIFEDDKEITVVADLPGVGPDQLNIDLRESTLSILAEVESPVGEGEREVASEYRTGRYFRQFSLANTIDQAKIEAKLTDGVLRLTLPKQEKARPRRIEVSAGS